MKNLLLLIVILALAATTFMWSRYGGGSPYPDLSTTPGLSPASLEVVLEYSEPIGNVAVSSDGRLFFTVHPESRPVGNKLLEYVSDAAVPFPSGAVQDDLFDTVLGVAIDRFDRLWTIDHGNHGLRSARLVAIDLNTHEVLLDRSFDSDIAPAGSFLQDLQISSDGRTVVIADASFWRKTPAIIIYDVPTNTARRVLESHASVLPEDFVIRSQGQEMTFMGGVVALRGGVDGIALGPEWLYFGALSGSGLYRVRLEDLRNTGLRPAQLADSVERFSDKPLSDGLSRDVAGNVYITDVEHSAIFVVGPEQELATLIQSRTVRWPDALSFGPGGFLYLADSALPDVVLKSRERIKAAGPYRIFRFEPGFEGVPGQ